MSFRIPPALRYRNFRLLWLGLMISMAGSQMQVWALYWHIRTLSNDPIAVSGIGIVRFIPVLVFSLYGGLVADRMDRRKVLYLTQTLMTLTAFALGYLTWRGTISLWYIYLLTGIQAVAMAFDLPARQALTPNLVPVEVLPSAFSVQSIASQVGAIVGPGLTGVVIAYWGQQYVYFINAISFLAVLGALVLMGNIPQKRVVPANGQKPGIKTNLAAIKEGVQFIRTHPIIWNSMILDFFATFFSSANTLLPYVATDILHVGSIEYGWLSAAQSIGAVAAALILSQGLQLRKQGALLLGSVGIFGLATTIFGLSKEVVLTFVCLILIGASDSVSTIVRNTVRQLQTPDYIRGRMVSINQIFFMGGPQLGEIEAGIVAQSMGTPMAIITGGIGCILAMGWIAWRSPQLRRYNGDEPVVAGGTAD